jgi:hypothetical protein
MRFTNLSIVHNSSSANLRFAAAKINKKKETPNGLKNGKKKKGR